MTEFLRGLSILRILCAFFLVEAAANAKPLDCDLSQYQVRPGLEAAVAGEELAVHWDGEANQKLRARFAIVDGVPTVRELAIVPSAGSWQVLGRDLTPEFQVTTGIRRTNHGLPEENRWDVFWDTPLNKTNEVRRFTASYRADRCEVKTEGARLEEIGRAS